MRLKTIFWNIGLRWYKLRHLSLIVREVAIMSLWEKFKNFYKASAENRLGFYNLLAFLVVPTIGMAILYVLVRIFWLK